MNDVWVSTWQDIEGHVVLPLKHGDDFPEILTYPIRIFSQTGSNGSSVFEIVWKQETKYWRGGVGRSFERGCSLFKIQINLFRVKTFANI
jgi:hypothetical protein